MGALVSFLGEVSLQTVRLWFRNYQKKPAVAKASWCHCLCLHLDSQQQSPQSHSCLGTILKKMRISES